MQPGADGQMNRPPHELLGKRRQFRLALGARPSNDQPRFLMKDTDIPLAVEVVLVVNRLRAHQSRECYLPGSDLPNTGGNGHLEGIIWRRLRRWFGWPVVIIQGILRNASQDIHAEASRLEEVREELSVTATIREIRKREVGPRTRAPVPVPVIDDVYRRAIQKSEVLMESCSAPQHAQRVRIVRPLPIQSNT